MEISVLDLIVLLDATYAALKIKSLNTIGCKYTHDQVKSSFERIHSELGKFNVSIVEEGEEQ